MTNPDFIRYCPKCNREIEPSNILMFDFIKMGFTMARFEAPYFLCGNCRLACIDKTAIRKKVSLWRNCCLITWSRKKLPHKKVCEMVVEKLEKLLKEYFIPRLGYKKIGSFNKIPRAS